MYFNEPVLSKIWKINFSKRGIRKIYRMHSQKRIFKQEYIILESLEYKTFLSKRN